MKKSELKEIIKECINEARSVGYATLSVSKAHANLDFDEFKKYMEKAVAIANRELHGIKMDDKYTRESQFEYNVTIDLPDGVFPRDLQDVLPDAAKKANRELGKMIDGAHWLKVAGADGQWHPAKNSPNAKTK